MIKAIEQLSVVETGLRHNKVRALLGEKLPQAGGLLVFSSLNIYYLTGTLPAGVLWLPVNGEPVLLVRKGLERAVVETSLKHVLPLRSYSDIASACAEVGSPLSGTIAAEMSGLTWAMSSMLQGRMKDTNFVDGSQIIVKARSVKTPYEIEKMRSAGSKHLASYEALAKIINPAMTEREIAIVAFNEFLKREHAGILRMSGLGAEAFLGQMASGDNCNYPTYWDGPVGYLGGHPATPYMGNASTIWGKNSSLVIDLGFDYQGYHTDKTQVFWSGSKNSLPEYLLKAHEVCVEIQNQAAEALKPGAIPEQIWQQAVATANKAGLSENFMGTGGNQVKFLGHGIGLSYDEFPPLANRFVEPILEGMTIAIEPKMGFKGVGMVGTENVFEVTAQGARSITGNNFDIVFVD